MYRYGLTYIFTFVTQCLKLCLTMSEGGYAYVFTWAIACWKIDVTMCEVMLGYVRTATTLFTTTCRICVKM